MVREEPQPEAGKSFLEYLVSTGEKDVDLNNAPSFDTTALHAVYDIRASEGKLVCKFPVTELVQNRFNTLHGGCIATLVDVVTSAALVTLVRQPSVSLTMSIDYLNPAHLGTVVEVEGKVVKVGKTIAVTDCEIRRLDGTLVAQGKHTKFFKEVDFQGPKVAPPAVEPRSRL